MNYLRNIGKNRPINIKEEMEEEEKMKQKITKKGYKKENRGITLVALVVTIVVLLILSGITITVLFGDNGIISQAQKAKTETERDQGETENGIANLTGQMNDILGIKEPIAKETSYVGYYADIEGDGTVDGVIYADQAKGKTGTWSTTNPSTYTIPTKSNLKDYYISKKAYEGAFETKDVVSPIPGSTGDDRFYIMALNNEKDSSNNETLYFYYNASSGTMTDYESTTKTGFGEGKTNTTNMIAKWEKGAVANGGYGEQNARDMWGVIKDKVSGDSKWFVPSKDEWSAFAGELKISKTSGDATYYGNFGLSSSYWSSSQRSTNGAWRADFIGGYMIGITVNGNGYVRLSATF